MRTKPFFRSLLILVILTSVSAATFGASVSTAGNQNSIEQLEAQLKAQYSTIEKVIAKPPRPADFPSDYGRHLREWQDDLAQSFANAAATVAEIIALNPANREMWQERLDTLRLYSQPISRPDQRTVYGSREVEKSARLVDLPLAVYTDEALAANIHGDVRLRLVLASDGTVKNVFPIKSLSHGLTESAMAAARQIKFEPALINHEPVSQFETLVYEFAGGHSRRPYIPGTIF